MRTSANRPSHPHDLRYTDVSACTAFLIERANIPQIFSPMEKYKDRRTKQRAAVVGGLWHLFSDYMPSFLCEASALLSNNQQRFPLIQIIWEEMGSGHPNDIHAQMFKRAVVAAGITPGEIDSIQERFADGLPLNSLGRSLRYCRDSARVLGLCAGLEAPAKDNIEMLFDSLAYTPGIENGLSEEPFFKLHRIIEEEHISLGTSNYLRFCTEPRSRKAFLSGFDSGVSFFRVFWIYLAEVMSTVERNS